ncbi:helix-turn-helix domain-containing protein [Planococcus halotolerans]|uniref:XRE family transcriptional regulator n=1 Tax=Planococcus halotolerans TaxID=2233542 RepID=A0A365KRF8_9BACL|nr:helix-turn-helix transcriptional regulator [Planococcus halotolerans]QHJ69265.1 helix-turn-helix domain-containing protein [Planococcus halotolerans]RAZ75758.1 XRE family transcriptional regulator [Planococcus halotolerans]
MASLGERIRKLRKEKGLTLQALAGEELSKGMLSLIENNKANPSMESLAYIADRLAIDKNELLEEFSTAEIRKLLQEVEELYKVDIMSKELIKEYKTIVAKIQLYKDKLPFRYESARLLEIYSRCSYHAKIDGWKSSLKKAEEIYEGLQMINQSAEIHIFRAMTSFTEHRYSEALTMIQESRKVFEERVRILDPLKKLDFDYYESILYSAIGDGKNAIRIMQNAIDYSKEQQIFYRVDSLYRLAGFQAVLDKDIERKNYYCEKLRLFANFLDDEEMEAFSDAIEIHYLNTVSHEFEKANEIIDRNLAKHEEITTFLFTLEKGKALYGMGMFEEALVWLKKHEMWEFLHHPYDLSLHYEKDAYLALVYEKLGDHQSALEHAEIAKVNIEPMPDLPYKKFIMKVYDQINS